MTLGVCRPQSGDKGWSSVESSWRTIASLVRWCDGGREPSAVNVNLYRDSQSQVRWHSDDEPLCGVSRESELIVHLILGASALIRWKPRRSCSLCVEDGLLLSHGDLLVMGGSAQDKLTHQTDPGLECQGINLTSRWIEQFASRLLKGTK